MAGDFHRRGRWARYDKPSVPDQWIPNDDDVVPLWTHAAGSIDLRRLLIPRFFTPFKDLPEVTNPLSIALLTRMEHSYFELDEPHWTFHDTPPQCRGLCWNSRDQKPDGLLRSYMPHAREMLLVLSPEGLADVLVRKPYDFVKPDHIKFDLSYLFAKGLFTAEGAQHKVSGSMVFLASSR